MSPGQTDTAAVRVLCQGRGRADGADFRVLDSAGKPVPFEVTFHDPARYALISFRANAGHGFVYFGNAGAERAPEQIVAPTGVGTGPPKGAWIPRQGLVLQTLRRPAGENPNTAEEMARLIAASPAKDGARYQRRVADGFNPFGSSDGYISIYRGWIDVPKAGTYRFCTASNEASFSFLDGKELVHWPGRHTVERGMRGEKNATVTLSAGPHYLEYYHEEVALEQMAYLGWRTSGDDGPFEPIPDSVFPAPREARVMRYEGPDGRVLPTFDPIVVDSIWPTDRHEGQYTRVRFETSAGADARWDFGDGQTADGATVEHVYLALGTYDVTLKAAGNTVRWPLIVFEIENVTDRFPEGRLHDYVAIASKYDLATLDAPSLRELPHLLTESEAPSAALDAGKRYVERFGSSRPETVPRMRRLMADCALQLGQGGIEEAIGQFEASLTGDTSPVERLDVLARLIRLIGIDRNAPDQAGALLPRVEAAVKGSKLDDATLAAYRRAVIAAADVLLWNGRVDGARSLYDRAEKLGGKFIPRQVRAARVGAYPGAIREAIDASNFGAALDIVDQWDETFPTDKPNGQTLYWRGKLLALRGQPREAARHLARAIGLAPGAAFESEARWLLAEALGQSGKPQEARKELARLAAAGVKDEFTQRAVETLKRHPGP